MLSSASKWTAEWNQQFSTWTTCWTLDQHCSPPGTPFPLLWCRHDRIAPERLLVFWRDTQLYGRRGAPKMVTPRPGGGKTEDIEFVAAGMRFHLAIKTGVAPTTMLGSIGESAAPIEYILRVFSPLCNGEEVLPDHLNRSLLRRVATERETAEGVGFGERVGVTRWRHHSVCNKGSLDWKPEVVVEYEVQYEPPMSSGDSEPLVSWARFSAFTKLATDLISCYQSSVCLEAKCPLLSARYDVSTVGRATYCCLVQSVDRPRPGH